MVSRHSLWTLTVRSSGIWTICFLATVCMLLISSCGGGGDGGSSEPTPPPTTTTLYTTSDSHSVSLAKVSGTTIQGHNVDILDQEVYSGNATLNSNNAFSINFSLYPAGGATVGSAYGSIDATGNTITATVVITGQANRSITLTKTTSSTAGGYYGTYSGSSSGTFVAGVTGSGIVMGFAGNDIDGWESFSTTLSGNTFSGTTSLGTTFSGSISGNAAAGTWSNVAAGESGTFNGPKVF